MCAHATSRMRLVYQVAHAPPDGPYMYGPNSINSGVCGPRSPTGYLHPSWVTRHEARRGGHAVRPAGSRLGQCHGVEAFAVHHHEGVF